VDDPEKDCSDLTVRDATLADLEVVASWVSTEEECRLWAGPAVSFPLLPARLEREIGFPEAENLALFDEAGAAGFGQVVPKTGGRAHLARVIVRPDARGRSLGHRIVRALVERARGEARAISLNVYASNATALRVYEAAGFRVAPWPEDDGAAPPGVLHLTLDL
jgi:ribosomal-protein-alanine N-acetyltransferase